MGKNDTTTPQLHSFHVASQEVNLPPQPSPQTKWEARLYCTAGVVLAEGSSQSFSSHYLAEADGAPILFQASGKLSATLDHK